MTMLSGLTTNGLLEETCRGSDRALADLRRLHETLDRHLDVVMEPENERLVDELIQTLEDIGTAAAALSATLAALRASRNRPRSLPPSSTRAPTHAPSSSE